MIKIGIVGLGYVGLPLAVEFAGKYPVWGFDISEERIGELNKGHDRTLEVKDRKLKEALDGVSSARGMRLTTDIEQLRDCNIYIVTVPTPVDSNKTPDFTPLKKASVLLGGILKKGDTVVYESTVYPGATEEICVPILEKISNFTYKTDFQVGYSPERINPGDKERTLTRIKKVVSGSSPETADQLVDLYGSIIEAGVFRASSIRVAEAAKVIENAQRDINIAFVNELAMIFNRLGIDTLEVLEAAGTKWNFLPFRPGLVGGHCIGVDPYYLALKAKQVGYHPEMILAGRRINDSMGRYVAQELIKLMVKKDITLRNARVLMLGITFKENCPDIRNTRVMDICRELIDYDLCVEIHDPWASPAAVKKEFGIDLLSELPPLEDYQAILLCVAHDEYRAVKPGAVKSDQVWYDVKGLWMKHEVSGRL